MSYKDKTLMTVLLLFVLFGWLIAQNITPPIEEISTGQYVEDIWIEHPMQGVEVFVVVEETLEQKIVNCKLNVGCSRMAEAVVYEARSESLQGRYAVASVILNRVDSKRFPNTIEGVVTQASQFSYLKDMHRQATPTKKDWTEAYVIAYNTKNGKVGRVTTADHYLNPKKLTRIPNWARMFRQVGVIGNHHFYASN